MWMRMRKIKKVALVTQPAAWIRLFPDAYNKWLPCEDSSLSGSLISDTNRLGDYMGRIFCYIFRIEINGMRMRSRCKGRETSRSMLFIGCLRRESFYLSRDFLPFCWRLRDYFLSLLDKSDEKISIFQFESNELSFYSFKIPFCELQKLISESFYVEKYFLEFQIFCESKKNSWKVFGIVITNFRSAAHVYFSDHYQSKRIFIWTTLEKWFDGHPTVASSTSTRGSPDDEDTITGKRRREIPA